MLTETDLIELKKEELPARAAALTSGEIAWLVDLLAERTIRFDTAHFSYSTSGR